MRIKLKKNNNNSKKNKNKKIERWKAQDTNKKGCELKQRRHQGTNLKRKKLDQTLHPIALAMRSQG